MISKQAVLDVLKNYGLDDLDTAYLTAQINSLPSISDGWIRCEDGLPEKDGDSSIYCLVSTKHDGIIVRPYNEYHKCWDQEDGDDHYTEAVGGDVTHWQPLPPAPTK